MVKCGEETRRPWLGKALLGSLSRRLNTGELDGEAFATGAAAALHNLLSGTGLHTRTKTVRFGALTLLWLVGSFCHNRDSADSLCTAY